MGIIFHLADEKTEAQKGKLCLLKCLQVAGGLT